MRQLCIQGYIYLYAGTHRTRGCPLDGILHNYSSQAVAAAAPAPTSALSYVWTMLVACHSNLQHVCVCTQHAITTYTSRHSKWGWESSSNAQLMSLGFVVKVASARISLTKHLKRPPSGVDCALSHAHPSRTRVACHDCSELLRLPHYFSYFE